MSLLDTIKKDHLQSRKDRDSVKSSLLTTLIGELQTKEINAQKVLSDADVCATIKKFVNGVQETIALRPSDNSTKELLILESYLPKMIDDDDLGIIINDIIDDLQLENMSIKSLGTILKELKARHEGKYDGKLATEIVKGILS